MAEVAKWYVVHTYSGYENTVKATIERTVESRGLQEQIHAVSIPLETVTEVTESGATKTYDRKVFPGYVLVKMIMSDDAWYVIKNVRGVTGFVGSGTKPTPLTEDEVLQLGVEKREIVVNYAVGDTVRIADGPLLHRRGGGSGPGEEQGPRGRIDVRPRNPGGAGARPGRSDFPVNASGRKAGTWEGLCPDKDALPAHEPHLFRRCLLWHRK